MNPTPHLAAFLGLALALGALPASADARFTLVDRSLGGGAEWVSAAGQHIAFGAGAQVLVGQAGPPVVVQRQVAAGLAAHSGVLVEDLLYLGGASDLVRIDLSRPAAAPVTLALDPPVRGALHLAQMDDYLAVVEDGHGLRILTLPPHGRLDASGCTAHASAELAPVASLALEGSFRGIAASMRQVYLVSAAGELTVVDARRPQAPFVARRIALGGSVDDIAANGDIVYAVGPAGLTLVDLASTPPRIDGPHGDLAGSGIGLAGRTTYLALGPAGLATWHDGLAPTANINVSVGSNFFNPKNITIAQGDSVTWQKGSTGAIPHNVRSCVPAQTGCAGQAATESFTSGAATSAPFTFVHTFTAIGANPYVCTVHANLGMTGSVTVVAPTPPAVPGLAVSKLDPAGSQLELDWLPDCGSTQHLLITGSDADFPATPGGVYGVGGGVCGIGSPVFGWNGVPLPASDQYLWFLLLARQASTEGSWGTDSFGNQRHGAGTAGSSAQCTITTKSVSNACGQ